MTLQTVHFYETPQRLPGAFDSLFGGFFLVKGIPLIGQLAALVFLGLALVGAYFASSGEKRWARISTASAFALFSLLWLFLVQPWDELFINLRHARHFAEEGRFSFNRHTWLEGTVDFLPYWLVGLGQRWGIPVLEGAFALSYLGGLGCLILGLRLLRQFVPETSLPFAFLALAVYPPLAYNSGSGFMASVFVAGILGIVLTLFYEERIWIGMAGLALLPLLRPEAVLLCILFLGIWWHTARASRPAKIAAVAAVFIPFALHTLARHHYYGQVVPLPIQFKASLGSLFFLAVGIRNAIADAVATQTATLGIWLVLLASVCRRNHTVFPLSRGAEKETRILLPLLAALAIFTVPYYLSGGDWFPSYWARYFLPLGYFGLIVALICTARVIPRLKAAQWGPAVAVGTVFFILSSLWPISSTWKLVDHFFAHRRTLAMIHDPTIARAHYRIQNLSQLGEHLRRTTLESDRIGSSELATVMFFARREGVDFLGLINPEIAASPLRPMPSLLRRFPYRSELPYLIFKRLRPDLLAKTQPEILYTFDFMLRDQAKDVRPFELTRTALFKALGRWEILLGGLMDPLYGGLENILALGYEPVVIRAGDDFVSLYFVHRAVLPRHLSALKTAGYGGGKIFAPASLRCTHPAEPCSEE